jgi:hypothetical protein
MGEVLITIKVKDGQCVMGVKNTQANIDEISHSIAILEDIKLQQVITRRKLVQQQQK